MRWRVRTVAMIMLVPSVSGAVIAASAVSAQAGCSHVAGDFNGDGYADVAAAAPYFNSSRGRVVVAWGGPTGVQTTYGEEIDASQFSQLTPATDDFFGNTIATGNFNGDCYADLAISIPGDAWRDEQAPKGIAVRGGAFMIVYGSPYGLIGGSQIFFMDQFFTPSETAGDVHVVAGDFNGDGNSDLAVGSTSAGDGGEILVLRGSSTSGITIGGAKVWSQDTTGVPGTGEVGDGWGAGLVAADFNGDRKDDLAIGAPGEDYTGVSDGGAVTILPGSSSGLTATGSQMWTEATTGMPGAAESEDFWGSSLAAGDITGDSRADLAVGDPLEDVGTTGWAGAVTVLHGAATGLLTTHGAQLIDEDTTGVPGVAEADDEFGMTLAIGDFNGDGYGDLAVGDPDESVDGASDAGTVTVLPGTSTGVSTSRATLWDQNTTGIMGSSDDGDSFGDSLIALPIRANSVADLVIGDMGERIGTLSSCGAVAIIPGSSSGLTATGNQILEASTLVTGNSASEGLGGDVA